MVIEINKDIDRYQESVALGLSAKQLIFSITSVVVGGGLVLFLYKAVGLTVAAYIAIPCVAPIALGGFYSFNGMSFYEYMQRKIHYMFFNKAYTYVSDEGEPAIKRMEAEQNGAATKGSILSFKTQKKLGDKPKENADKSEKNEEAFEAMKKKTKRMLIGLVGVILTGIIAAIVFKLRK